MSNVLIGIIGVILFIGLALAGALFLGPRFQSASNSSKGSAAIQSVKQVSDAVQLYRLQEGQPLGINSLTELTSKGYLKTLPKVGTSNVSVINETGCAGCTTGTLTAVGFYLGNDTAAKAVCEAIARQTGQVPSGGAYDPESRAMLRNEQTTETGCTRIGSEFYVFSFL